MLINNIEDLYRLLPSVMIQDFGKFETASKVAQEWLVGVLGDDLFQAVISIETLKDKCQLIVACRAYYELIPELDIVNSPNGFAIVNDSKLAPASRDRVSALREAVRVKGENAEASLYEAVEDKTELRTMWTKRPRTTVISNSLTPTFRDFESYAEFNGGYDEWRASRFKHRELLITKIAPIISAAVVAKIIEGDSRYEDLADTVRFAFVSYFNGSDATATSSLLTVRDRLMSDLEKFPEFANSASNYQRQTFKSSDSVGIFM